MLLFTLLLVCVCEHICPIKSAPSDSICLKKLQIKSLLVMIRCCAVWPWSYPFTVARTFRVKSSSSIILPTSAQHFHLVAMLCYHYLNSWGQTTLVLQKHSVINIQLQSCRLAKVTVSGMILKFPSKRWHLLTKKAGATEVFFFGIELISWAHRSRVVCHSGCHTTTSCLGNCQAEAPGCGWVKSFVKKVLHERLLLTVLVASRLLRLPLLFHVCFQTLTSQVVANLEKGGQKVCVALFTFVLQLSEIFPFILLTSLPLPFKVQLQQYAGVSSVREVFVNWLGNTCFPL